MTTNETVISNAPPPDAAVTPPAEDLATIKAELAAAKADAAEKTRVADYWYQQRSQATAAPPEPKPEPEPEEDIDVLDALTTKGVKGLDEILSKRGYVRADEVDARVNSRANQMAAEHELLTQYPDLGKSDSEFFQSTAQHYNDLRKQGVPDAVAMRQAARNAELDGIHSGKVKTPAQKTTDTTAQRQADRQARANAQAGDRGGRQAVDLSGDDELSDNDHAAVRQLADALDITEAAAEKRYIARAKAGVNVALKLDRRK
jgi:hypothetical protein